MDDRMSEFCVCLNTAARNDDQFSLPWTEYTSL